LAARGGGLVALHWAMGTRAAEPIEPYLKLFGGCHGGADRKYQVVETLLHIADRQHPIAAGLDDLRVRDEFYYKLKFVNATPPIEPVMQATIDGQAETVAWSWQRPDGGRSFGFSGLHFHENWQLPEYKRLLPQGVLWTLKLPGN
jgi:type 1 glutamine amidotransferase